MKALTLHQPWASAIPLGLKRIETRSWPTRYRRPLAIHAAKSLNGLDVGCLVSNILTGALSANPSNTAGVVLDLKQLPLGQVVALATLVEVQPITEANIPPEPERSFGNYTPGRFAWRLADVRPLGRPIPARGGRRLWEWDIVEAMAQAAHLTTDLEEYGALMNQAATLLSATEYAAFFAKFLLLRDGVIK